MKLSSLPDHNQLVYVDRDTVDGPSSVTVGNSFRATLTGVLRNTAPWLTAIEVPVLQNR